MRATSPAETTERARQSVLESVAEIPIEIRVNDRIQRRIEVSSPEHDNTHYIGVFTIVTKGRGHVEQKKGQPAQDECTHNDTQRSRCFVLPFHFEDVLILGWSVGVDV